MEKPAETNLDPKQVRACLDEIDAELFKVADSDDCQRFHKDTQLTAIVLLLMRASSLMRPLLSLFEQLELDAFDAVLRAWEETWYMAHELRLSASADKSAAWLRKDKDTWSAKIGVLVEFAKKRGHPGPNIGRDYGLLSELAHPTRTAAEKLCHFGRCTEMRGWSVSRTRRCRKERCRAHRIFPLPADLAHGRSGRAVYKAAYRY